MLFNISRRPSTSGLYNTPTLMVIRLSDPFLFQKQVNPPPVARCFENQPHPYFLLFKIFI
eukprot:UN01165